MVAVRDKKKQAPSVVETRALTTFALSPKTIMPLKSSDILASGTHSIKGFRKKLRFQRTSVPPSAINFKREVISFR